MLASSIAKEDEGGGGGRRSKRAGGAHELATSCAGGVDVTVYEKEDCLGGSFARTVGVDGGAGGEVVHLHLGFMPFNSVGAHMNIYIC